MTMKTKNILLIDDNEQVREIIAENLRSQDYEVVESCDGADALNKLDQNQKWYCIISDLQMPHITGIMFLKIIRERGLKIPLIFITGFDNIIETEEAFRLGAQAFLSKPFDEEDLYKKLRDVESYNSIINRPETEMALDDFYCKVHIDEFISGKKIIYPVFLKLSASKFIKIAHTGEDLNQDKIDGIKKHGVEYFYLQNEDFKDYIKRNVNLAKRLLLFHEIEDEKKRDFFVSISKNILDYQFTREINSETFSMSLFTIHNTLKFVSEKKDFLDTLQTLHLHSPTGVEHSMLVSLIASSIALQSDEFNSKTVLMVALSALYHDIGMKELPAELEFKPLNLMTPEELKLYKTHPQLASQLLSEIKELPDTVAQAILHHHEHCDGSGYPFGIGRIKIHPIARVIAVADFIASEWILEENKNATFKAIVMRLKEKSEIFDREFVDAAIQVATNKEPLFKTFG